MTAAARLLFPEPLDPSTPELRLPVDGDELVGTSIGAIATAFALPGFDTAVDMGRCSPLLAEQDTVLLTHCHSDHVAGLVAWLSAHTRRHRGRPTRIVLPAGRRAAMLAALTAWPDLDGVRRRVSLGEVLLPAEAGDRVELGRGAFAIAFAVRHNTVALGWSVHRTAGDRPWLAFAGDSTVEPFRERAELLDATAAIVDCSFVAPGTRVAARLGGHGHLADWLELAPRLACGTLILGHLPPDPDLETVAAAVAGLDARPDIVAWSHPPPGSPLTRSDVGRTTTDAEPPAGHARPFASPREPS